MFKIGDRVQVAREPADPRWYKLHDVGIVTDTDYLGIGELVEVDFGPYHTPRTRGDGAKWAVNVHNLELVPEAEDEP